MKYGHIKEENDAVVYEIPKAQTNLLEQEQLDELRRDDPLFFTFQACKVDDEWVRIYYKKEPGYKPVKNYKKAPNEIKQRIVTNMLALENLIGTQYTTAIDPNNIYADDEGNVKLAHRGIRSVLPTEEVTSPQLLSELKKMVVYLFSSYDYSDITDSQVKNMSKNDPFIKAIYDAGSLKQLRHVLVSTPVPEPSNSTNKETVKKFAPVLSAFVIGLILGAAVLYIVTAGPLAKEVDQLEDQQQEETASLESEIEELQTSLDEQRSITSAYESAFKEDPEGAILVLENMDNLNNTMESLLLNQYLNLDNAVGYTKVAELGSLLPLEALEGLKKADNEDAEEAILSMKVDDPEVNIEQAWLKEEYQEVIDIYDEIPDNIRAKLLAGKSYIEQEKPEKAMELGKDLENKKLQIASLELQKDEVKDDDDLDDDEEEDKLDELDDEIDKLK